MPVRDEVVVLEEVTHLAATGLKGKRTLTWLTLMAVTTKMILTE
jgi:hypothetical protein